MEKLLVLVVLAAMTYHMRVIPHTLQLLQREQGQLVLDGDSVIPDSIPLEKDLGVSGKFFVTWNTMN